MHSRCRWSFRLLHASVLFGTFLLFHWLFQIFASFSTQSFYGFHDGYDMQDLVLLQTFLGLSLAVGIVASGSSINKTCQVANSRKIRISRQYVCQGCVILVSISIVIFSMLSTGYHTLCLVTWMYGLGLGGYRCEAEVCWLKKMIYCVFFIPRFFKNARARARSGEIFHTRVGWVWKT